MYIDAVRVHLGETSLLEIEQAGEDLSDVRVSPSAGGGGLANGRFDRCRVVDLRPQLEVETRSPSLNHLAHRRGDFRNKKSFLGRDLADSAPRSASRWFGPSSSMPGSREQRPRRSRR